MQIAFPEGVAFTTTRSFYQNNNRHWYRLQYHYLSYTRFPPYVIITLEGKGE